jgi:hypothetical protein
MTTSTPAAFRSRASPSMANVFPTPAAAPRNTLSRPRRRSSVTMTLPELGHRPDDTVSRARLSRSTFTLGSPRKPRSRPGRGPGRARSRTRWPARPGCRGRSRPAGKPAGRGRAPGRCRQLPRGRPQVGGAGGAGVVAVAGGRWAAPEVPGGVEGLADQAGADHPAVRPPDQAAVGGAAEGDLADPEQQQRVGQPDQDGEDGQGHAAPAKVAEHDGQPPRRGGAG